MEPGLSLNLGGSENDGGGGLVRAAAGTSVPKTFVASAGAATALDAFGASFCTAVVNFPRFAGTCGEVEGRSSSLNIYPTSCMCKVRTF